jgi:hypothetical protein
LSKTQSVIDTRSDPMKAFKKWHARVSLRVVVIGVLLGAAGIVGWQFGRMPDNNGIDLRHHKEQSVVISPPAPPASAVQMKL